MPVATTQAVRRSVAWWRSVGWRSGPAAAALAGTALLIAGCGSASAGPAVASLPTATASATPSSASRGDPVRYSQCMRAHGVPNFPDPGPNGGIAINAGKGALDPRGPQFKAAEAACKSLAPQGPPPDPKVAAQQQQAFLAYSKCMREHGIVNFPDPKFDGNSTSLELPHGINPKSTKFKAADKICQKLMPNGGPGGRTTTGGGGVSSGSGPGSQTGTGDS